MINHRYSIIKKIGEGRSKVFLCNDKFFPNEKIAIKILQYTANDSEIEFFNNEFKIIKRLSHPNIISVHDIGSVFNIDKKYKSEFKISENDKFITMEWIDGKRLSDIKAFNSENELIEVIKQISLALFFIHQANYIYFDLKPENILIYSSSEGVKVKIIDFGLAVYYPELNNKFTKGTSEYLAPEILKNDTIDFNVDLYSFGILLYHFAYNKFPFSNENELEIYRAHLEKDFEFPSSRISSRIIKIIKKLLIKNPRQRYKSPLEIISALECNLTVDDKLSLSNSFCYVERDEAKKKIDNFLNTEIWGKLAIVTGENGIGKTLFLESICNERPNVVLIKTTNFISATNFWQQFFSRLIYSDVIYRTIDDSLIQYVLLHIDDNSEELLVELKTIISKIASSANFNLAIDDFDKLDNKNIEIFYELFPILLANQIKIIISAENFNNIDLTSEVEKENVELKPFSNKEIILLVEKSYNKFVNRKELENLILSFAVRIPARIQYFVTNLIINKIIDFDDGIVAINYDDSKIDALLLSHENFYEVQKNELSREEIKVLETISLFKNDISMELISKILDVQTIKIIDVVNSLRDRSILQPSNINRNSSFINSGFKKHLYSKMESKEISHKRAGDTILEHFPKLEVLIIIRQYELAKEIEHAKQIILDSLNQPTYQNYPQIRIKFLLKLLSYEIDNDDRVDYLVKLCDIYINIGKNAEALNLIAELSKLEIHKYSAFQRERLHGVLLVKTGDLSQGIKKLVSVVDNLPSFKNGIYIDLASAYIELNKYENANSICNELLKQSNAELELIGRAQNLLGISNMYDKADLNITLNYFKAAHKTYTSINNFNRIAGSEVNLGNIQNILGNYSRAEKHWNKALQLNRSIGNVEQEANVLLNNGIFYYEHAYYEKAIEVYGKAGTIYKGLGNKLNFGLVSANLAETYIEICEFQKALDSINISKKIFTEIENNNELVEILLLEAKLYYSISNFSKFKNILESIKNFVPIKNERSKLLIKFYSLFLNKINSGKWDLEKLNFIKKGFSLNNDRILAADLQFILANEYIKINEFGISISLLHSKLLTDTCEFNLKYEANRLYLLSKIPTKYQSDLILTKNYLLQKAYSILQNNSISELSLKVLKSLSLFYFERGNNTKAVEYASYSEAIVEYIAIETISEEELSTFFTIHIKNIINHNNIILSSE